MEVTFIPVLHNIMSRHEITCNTFRVVNSTICAKRMKDLHKNAVYPKPKISITSHKSDSCLWLHSH